MFHIFVCVCVCVEYPLQYKMMSMTYVSAAMLTRWNDVYSVIKLYRGSIQFNYLTAGNILRFDMDESEKKRSSSSKMEWLRGLSRSMWTFAYKYAQHMMNTIYIS